MTTRNTPQQREQKRHLAHAAALRRKAAHHRAVAAKHAPGTPYNTRSIRLAKTLERNAARCDEMAAKAAQP